MTVFQNVRKGLIPARLTVNEVYDLTASGVFAEDEHFELIDGEIVPMAAAKANWHSMMEARLLEGLMPVLPRGVRLFSQASVTFSPITLLEPDIAIWPRHILPRDARGQDMLLLIEVADTSLNYDLRGKAELYAGFGVRDYWVVDAVRQTIRVHRAPIGDAFTDIEEYEGHDTVPTLLLRGVAIRLDSLD